MTDNKQMTKEEFGGMVKREIDAMFERPLTEAEKDEVIVREVGDILGQLTVMNNIESSQTAENTLIAESVTKAESGVKDLNRLAEVKDELDMAA